MINYTRTLRVCFYLIPFLLITASCVTTANNETALLCKELIKRNWGSGETNVGYDIENSLQSNYKLVLDDSGNILILDVYNNRIAKFDSEGKFQLYIQLPDPSAKEQFADIATTNGERIVAAIRSPITVESREENAYSAIYEFDGSGHFVQQRADWRSDKDFIQRVASGLSGQIPFHHLIASPDGSVYSLWLTGQITQYTTEGLARLIYNHAWQQVVAGWDGLIYVIDERDGQSRLLSYGPLNGNLLKRVPLSDFLAVKSGSTQGNLVGVDADGRLYLERLNSRTGDQSTVFVLSGDGNLESQVTLPGRLANVDKLGQLYVFTFSSRDVPSGSFSVEQCRLVNR